MHGEICIFGEFADIIMFMKVLRIMPVNTVPTPKTIFAAYIFTSGGVHLFQYLSVPKPILTPFKAAKRCCPNKLKLCKCY